MFVPHGDIVEMSSARLSSHLGQFRNAVPVSAGGRKGLEGRVVESGLGPGLLVNSPLPLCFWMSIQTAPDTDLWWVLPASSLPGSLRALLTVTQFGGTCKGHRCSESGHREKESLKALRPPFRCP